MNDSSRAAADRLQNLLVYLEADPANLSLLSDAADAALAAHRPDEAMALLDRIGAARELDDGEVHKLGLAALQGRDHERAVAIFRALIARGVDTPPIRFNLAWALAKTGASGDALALLDENVVAQLPQAAMLAIQLLHEARQLEDAAAIARAAVARGETHAGLMAAASVLAVDLDDLELARATAIAGGDHPDALATLGTLALEERPEEARSLFDRALDRSGDVPRAWVGRGLANLAAGRHADAARDLDRGADIFGDHLGSIVAAGWAHFSAQDFATARARFQRAHDIDPTFAEAHGALAVLDVMDGDPDAATRRMEIAFRLDRDCFAAALAQVLLRTSRGDEEGARRIFERAINVPIDASGRTVAQGLAKAGLASR